MSNRRSPRPSARKRAYTSKEAEKIAKQLPLQRRYSAIEAAHAVAQYLYPDPAFWLEQAGLAGMAVAISDGRICEMYPDGSDDQITFLSCWMALSEGKDALRQFLAQRAGGLNV